MLEQEIRAAVDELLRQPLVLFGTGGTLHNDPYIKRQLRLVLVLCFEYTCLPAVYVSGTARTTAT